LTSTKQHEKDALDQWIASPPIHTLTDSLSVEHLSDLYVTLPTRDGSRKPFREPQPGLPLPFGHHLAFFHAHRAERMLRADGTDEDISPPPPFSKRLWAGGKITWDANNPLIVGKPTISVSTVSSTEKKGFEKGNPMVFVTQNIQFTHEGQQMPSVTEERTHVYLQQLAEL
jgi:hydroxyacyl-ACP dehydratase HTD2-like protein with hotdog domain